MNEHLKLNQVYKTKGLGTLVKILKIMDNSDFDFMKNLADQRIKNLPVIGVTEHGQIFVWERDGSAPTEFNIDDQMDLVPLDWEPQKIVS